MVFVDVGFDDVLHMRFEVSPERDFSFHPRSPDLRVALLSKLFTSRSKEAADESGRVGPRPKLHVLGALVAQILDQEVHGEICAPHGKHPLLLWREVFDLLR